MNIKSELNKPFLWFKNISLSMIIASVFLAVGLGTIIIAAGFGIATKLIFLCASCAAALIYAAEGKWRDYSDRFKRIAIIFIMTICLLEIGLYYRAQETIVVPIGVDVTDEVRKVVLEKDEKGYPTKTKDEYYKKVSFYNLDTHKRIDYVTVPKENDNLVKMYSSVKAIEFYTDYFPFLVYRDGKYRYVRD